MQKDLEQLVLITINNKLNINQKKAVIRIDKCYRINIHITSMNINYIIYNTCNHIEYSNTVFVIRILYIFAFYPGAIIHDKKFLMH